MPTHPSLANSHTRTHVASSEPCTSDFHLFEMLDQHEKLSPGVLKTLSQDGSPRWPRLDAYHARFRALPQLQAYFASPMASLPVNNKMASFV